MSRLWPCFSEGARGTRGIGVLLVFASVGFAGCNSGLKFYKVHGVITLNGKPVEYAEMHIHPASEGPNRGRTMHVRIVDGKYDTRPTGVAAGPAEWTIAVAEPGTMRINNPDHISPEESERFLRVKKQVFVKQIEIDRDEINVELP
jgi:hypothetical protein